MRSFIRFIVDHMLISVIAAVAVIAIGISSIPLLKISDLPTVEMPSLVVTLTLPGASPAEIQNRVIFEIEDELQSLGDIDEFETDIFKSFAIIRIKFFYGVDINDKYLEVSSKLNKLQDELPSDLESSIEKQSPSDLLVPFVFALVGPDLTYVQRLNWSNQFKLSLRRNEFLQQIEVVKSDREAVVWLDMDRMRQYGISIDSVSQAIVSENRFLPVGTMEFGDQAVTIIPPGSSYHRIADVAATPLLTGGGKSIKLADIATVEEVYKPDPVLHRLDGQPATLITAKTRDDANVLAVREQIDVLLDQFRKQLPAGVELHLLYNVEEGVRRNITGLLWNVVQGIGILCVVLLFSVGYRSTFAIGIMLPFSLMLSLVWLSLTDFGLQQMSVAGFIIALGLIVDNGIVVTENAFKLSHYRGFNNRDAAVEGTGSVISPLISSTLTTALAFLPVFLLTSKTGLFMRSLSVTIWLCLGASLFIAVTVTTLSVSRFGTVNRLWLFPELPTRNGFFKRLNRMRKMPTPPSFLNALIPFRDIHFITALQAAIRHWWALLLLVLGLFVLAGWCVQQVPQIVFPDSDDPFFHHQY
ncbi:MAG: efflux RND transporter permease subunit [Immundisolibacteraceae bacterium]|nr:efflux RND transporter permease subunit [Immundisolibacteraceae bacterium]